ncbi:MAG: bifunctional phosphopantothenoylcysteine decarboxylase/phosphopantothenate--cysteine ligase CoaBC [Actinobacteria bacterium]|nr:bifunctional phosphopantothenoylcysteine decarboxylase/phosphopantothenate--cysteine ligase CoaBC [Actinomycetota bacterium]
MSNITYLSGKRVVLGVGGGIAAYKSVELLRRLIDLGAYVSPVLTSSALRFVGETTFSALASEPARTSLFDDRDPIPHTHLGQNCDLLLIAPATADLIARCATGLADDLLTTTLIATRAPVIMVAAMHSEMWEHASVQANIATLRSRGVIVLEPEVGRLAGGDFGVGRLASVDQVLAAIEQCLAQSGILKGKKVLVTAGGTREAIDPVRYIGNRSSGKQGIAFAKMASQLGAEVVLVTTVAADSVPNCQIVMVESASEMMDAVMGAFPSADMVVMAAAVADFRPKRISSTKLKKSFGTPEIVLEPTDDILAELGRKKRPDQIVIGFAAETGDPGVEAARKLEDKNADFIVANNVLEPGSGFSTDTNRVTLVGRDSTTEFEIASKTQVADKVLQMATKWACENGIWV